MILPLTRRTCLTTLLLGAGLQTSGVHAQHKLPPLKLGIMPFNSTLALIKTHQPLVQHLEAQLGRNVVVYTSADYFTYVNELLDGHFDLAIAGPHFGAMSQAHGMAILTRYKSTLQPVFVVKVGSPIQTLNDLRGKRVALSSRLSMSSIGGAKWLQDQGLKLGRDYQLVERSTHGAAVAAVAVGEVDAALTTHTPLKQIPEDVRAKIRVMPLDIHTPHLMTLARKRLGETDIDRIRKALLYFPDTPAGRAFFKETGYEGYSEVTTADLTQLKPFVNLTVDMMRQGK